jgi:hypothetical protein
MPHRAFIPFQRESPTKVHPEETRAPVEQHIAHALEYIASQMGDINSKLDRIIAEFEERPSS